jgi:hypothetical protein
VINPDPVRYDATPFAEDHVSDGAAAWPRRKLYGRRHGKRLRPTQARLLEALLPRLQVAGVAPADNPDRAPLAPEALFGDVRPLWLEIGFGGGEHLAAAAAPGFRVAERQTAVPWPEWPGTRYEAKALKAGRRPSYLTVVREET